MLRTVLSVAAMAVLVTGLAGGAFAQTLPVRPLTVEQRLAALEGQLAALNASVAGLGTPFYADVDCDAGQTIEDALRKAADASSVLLSVSGICHESVTIMRDDVGIIGQPGAGIAADAGQQHALCVNGGRRIWATGLSLQGGYSAPLLVVFGDFSGERLTISDGNSGVIAQEGASVRLSECTIEGSAFEGVRASDSIVSLSFCSVYKNRTYGIWAQHARIGLNNVEVQGSDTGVAGDGLSLISTAGQYVRIRYNQVGVRLKLNSVGWHGGALPDVSRNVTDFAIDGSSIW